MARKKRQRSDNVEVQTKLMKEAIVGIEPPPYIKLGYKERPFWDTIIAARADWTDIDMHNAAALARVQCMIEHESQALLAEGPMIKNKAGNLVTNPRIKGLGDLARLNMSYSVKMQVHAHATVGNLEDQVTKNKAKKQMIQSHALLENDEEAYFATPKITN